MRQLADVLVPDWSLGLVGFVPGGAVECDGGCAFHPSRHRHPVAVAAAPENSPAAFVDAGGAHGRDNDAEDARPAGADRARVGASFPRVLP